mmetsp:Transcript_20003/g.51922  ORF Transcript_20003/g.51922 Transcript_20003/m.51922 type:complete len:485 (-) Transcript_20003:113-1567(-)|eukprot:CAMPEP_0182935680 /NCGR_PEP_ID=MMETSP0105_2-20130417/38633_1 /TAXON_ID=81532 ORGANISM="Acanthoeca-like sp., Strain 10tr" /NCGR_SAMPLE_ID=MMETSP0105_2 /ASSEMBLY_ACC=CAM_ASM_000205 /LENGTH=484 /DNA_ID=CAMNT_0025074685 /DNA_START=65 /DNA_END=1519 /DNA_ORIENTATION=+
MALAEADPEPLLPELPGPFRSVWKLDVTHGDDGLNHSYVLDMTTISINNRATRHLMDDLKIARKTGNVELARTTSCILQVIPPDPRPGEPLTAFKIVVRGPMVGFAKTKLLVHPVGRRAGPGDVQTAIQISNLVIRRRLSESSAAFFSGLSANKDTFIRTLRRMPGVDAAFERGGVFWNRLAASAVVQCTVDVERFVPQMLRELHALVVDSLYQAVPTDSDAAWDKLLELLPGAKRAIEMAMASSPGDGRSGGLELLKMADRAGSDHEPMLKLALRKHTEEAVKECAPGFEHVRTTFKRMFPLENANSRRDVINEALLDIFRRGPVKLCLQVDEEKSVDVGVLRADGFQKLIKLAYGIRNLSGHGDVAKTIYGSIKEAGTIEEADIGPVCGRAGGATAEQIQDAVDVREALNALLDDIRSRRESYTVDEHTVINVHRIYTVYGAIVADAACLAVKKHLGAAGWAHVQCRTLERDPTPRDELWLA